MGNITNLDTGYAIPTDHFIHYWFYDASERIEYDCYALPGTAFGSIGWNIKKYAYTSTNSYPDTVLFAGGSNGFDCVGSGYAGFTYS